MLLDRWFHEIFFGEREFLFLAMSQCPLWKLRKNSHQIFMDNFYLSTLHSVQTLILFCETNNLMIYIVKQIIEKCKFDLFSWRKNAQEWLIFPKSRVEKAKKSKSVEFTRDAEEEGCGKLSMVEYSANSVANSSKEAVVFFNFRKFVYIFQLLVK